MKWVKQKVIGVRILGLLGVVVSIILLRALIYYNIHHEEFFSVTKNIVTVVYILLIFISSVGIIFLKEWARILLSIILSIKLGGNVIVLINYVVNNITALKMIHLFEQSIDIIIFLLPLYYLCRKSIRIQFVKVGPS